MATKFIFVTGGVVSGLGKGSCAASLGRLLKQRGLRVANQKFDPYLNVDPGTMSPFQHGEVFVTDDGAETDLDLGHYERFVDESLTGNSSVSSGKIYWSVLNRERRGDYLGRTVQIIPHITDEIKSRIYSLDDGSVDVIIAEIGGTVGDIESQPFLEAIRQVANERGRENVLFVHVPLIVQIPAPTSSRASPPSTQSRFFWVWASSRTFWSAAAPPPSPRRSATRSPSSATSVPTASSRTPRPRPYTRCPCCWPKRGWTGWSAGVWGWMCRKRIWPSGRKWSRGKERPQAG